MVDFQYPEIIENEEGEVIQTGWSEKKEFKGHTIANCHSEELKYPKKDSKAKQSPINIKTDSLQDCNLICDLSFNYKPMKCNIKKNKQNIIILDGDENCSVTFNNTSYPLQKIYFHTPAHHQIDGNTSAMEINLYHTLSDNFLPEGMGYEEEFELQEQGDEHPTPDEIVSDDFYKSHKGVIISILVKSRNEHIATNENKFISQFITNPKFRNLKADDDFKNIDVSEDWNVKDLLPMKKSFFNYDGSLPMPPCYETFKWVVFENQIEVLNEYLQIIKKEGNPQGFRNVHPLNNRIVFYNNNVEVIENVKEVTETKADMINNMLAPIRITTDSRSGVEYRKGAQLIVDSYMGGVNSNYNDDEGQLQALSNGWDELGKSGEQELTLEEIMELKGKDFEKYKDYVTSMIFDARRYNVYNYLDKYIEYKIEATKPPPELIKDACKELSEMNTKLELFKSGDTVEYTREMISNNLHKLDSKTNINEITTNSDGLNLTDPNEKELFLYLLNWQIDMYPDSDFVNLMDIIDSNDERFNIHNFILEELHNQHNLTPSTSTLNNLIFKFKGEDLTYTLEGDECQDWGSNEVHHEGTLMKVFNSSNILSKQGYTFDELDAEKRKLARDGLLNKDIDGKWRPHNKCRDPNNKMGAPWCYTKNPKVRWGYCMVPDRIGNSRRYLLVIIFILLIILSIYFVKMIFKHELFSQFIAKLTGAEFASEAVFKANQIVNNIKNNLKT